MTQLHLPSSLHKGSAIRARLPFVVGALVVVGALLRLWGLSRLSLMMDSIWIFFMCQQGVSPVAMMTDWLHVGGAPSTIPFAVASGAWFVQTFGLTVTIANLILPYALWGTATIPLAYLLGREMGRRRTGLLLCGTVAINPILVQISREAYFYGPLLFGAFLLTWAVMRTVRCLQEARLPPFSFHLANAVAVFVTAYSSPSGWSFVALCGLVQGLALTTFIMKQRRGITHLGAVAVTYILLGLPLLLADWGLDNILDFTAGPVKEYWQKVFRGGTGPNLGQLLVVGRQVLWGTTWPRTIFAVTVLSAGVLATVTAARRDRRWWLALAILAAIVGANLFALKKSLWGISIRYLAVVVPIYLLIACNGLAALIDRTAAIASRRCGERWKGAAYAWLAPALALWLPADYLVTRMTGQGMPYQSVVGFLDATLPRHSPVLTDRFFTAYNEYRAHAPTNVTFVSFGPNQIREEYNGSRYRERAEAFLKANPVSALHEEQHLWRDPEVGPWEWPHTFYARKCTFSDKASDQLRDAGLSLRGSGARTVYYNLPEDVVAKARNAKVPALVLYGGNWPCTQTKDHRAWRVMGNAATVDVYNLTTTNPRVSIRMEGVAVGKPKSVRAGNGAAVVFPANQLGPMDVGPFALPPGRSSIVLTDAAWNQSQTPLLVQRISAVTP